MKKKNVYETRKETSVTIPTFNQQVRRILLEKVIETLRQKE